MDNKSLGSAPLKQKLNIESAKIESVKADFVKHEIKVTFSFAMDDTVSSECEAMAAVADSEESIQLTVEPK